METLPLADPISAYGQEAAICADLELASGDWRSLPLRLMSALQTTLEVDHLLRLFSETVRDYVPHDGYAFRHEQERLDSAWGMQPKHACGYRLAIGTLALGELTLYRRRAFSDDETGLLDRLVHFLVFPLRNALSHRRVRECALRDGLTGAKNRLAFDEDVQRAVAQARRSRLPLSLLVVDIDHFKQVNDGFGHAIGDVAIKAVVDCARHCARDADSLYRYGGEEFVLVLENTALDGAVQLAERLRGLIASQVHTCLGRELRLSVSIGAARLGPGEDGSTLFRRADAALYEAKNGGRNRVCRAP